MSANLDSRISPALDPETYRAVENYNEDTRGYVDGVVNAFNDAYVTVGKIWDARKLADSNGAWNEQQKIMIVGKEADKQKDRVLTRLARAERDLTARITHTESELSKPLTERAGLGSLNTEVRSFARGLDHPQRHKFIMDAIESGDSPTLEAVLGAQPFLSGLTAGDHAHYLRTHHVRKNPQLVVRLDLMKRFMDLIERNGPVVHTQFAKATGAGPAQVSAVSLANDRAVAALNISPAD